MLWTVLVVLLILWILGFSFQVAGNLIHILLVGWTHRLGSAISHESKASLKATKNKCVYLESNLPNLVGVVRDSLGRALHVPGM